MSAPGLARDRLRAVWPRLRRPALRRPRLRRPTLRSLFSLQGLAVVATIALLLGIGWLWFRSSSFVQIRQVQVTGLAGPSVKRIRGALVHAARSMTTLNLSVAKLDAAVAGFADVRSLRAHTHFPHGLTIAVNEQVPVAVVTIGGKAVVVDSSGRMLTDTTIPHGLLPQLPLRKAPTGETITAPGARSALSALAWAPARMLSHIQVATWSASHGVVIRLDNGPALYLGDPTQLSAKWRAAIAVLADPSSRGAQYIDVSDPRRPAAGVTATGGG